MIKFENNSFADQQIFFKKFCCFSQ